MENTGSPVVTKIGQEEPPGGGGWQNFGTMEVNRENYSIQNIETVLSLSLCVWCVLVLTLSGKLSGVSVCLLQNGLFTYLVN